MMCLWSVDQEWSGTHREIAKNVVVVHEWLVGSSCVQDSELAVSGINVVKLILSLVRGVGIRVILLGALGKTVHTQFWE